MLRVGEVVSIAMLQWRRWVAQQREEAGGQQADQFLRQMGGRQSVVAAFGRACGDLEAYIPRRLEILNGAFVSDVSSALAAIAERCGDGLQGASSAALLRWAEDAV